MKYLSIFKNAAWQKSLIFTSLLALYNTHAKADINYEIESCCSLCPEVNDINAYNTEFLKVSQQLVEGNDGWLYRSKLDLDEQFKLDQETMADLSRFRAALAARGTTLLMVYQPTRGLINPGGVLENSIKQYDFNAALSSYDEALQQIRSTGIIVPPLTSLINKGDKPAFYFRRDAHWTPHGAMLSAELVSNTIKELDIYSLISTSEFKTSQVGLLEVGGSHQKAAYLICGTQYPAQYVDEFKTEPAEETEADLFGDASLPEIVAAGTSFTNAKANYNFVGYLKEFLSTDILNVGQAGGGVIGSLIQYLPTEDFQSIPPKLLIWEVPSYTSLSSNLNYRQLIPLVNNGCSNKPATLSRHVTLKHGENELLFNGGGIVKNLLSGDYLLDIQFSSPDIKRLDATVWYHNSRKERINIKQRDRVDAQGRFVFELRSQGEWKDFIFTSLDIDIDDSYPEGLEVTATMCQRDDVNL